MNEPWTPPAARGAGWIPPGYATLRSRVERDGAEKMRDDLYLGRCAAFEWDNSNGKLRPITREEWATSKAPYWLALIAPNRGRDIVARALLNQSSLDDSSLDDSNFEALLRHLYTFHLCPERILIAGNPASQPSPDGNAVSRPPPRQRKSPQADRIKQAIVKCFPSGTDGIPTKAVHKAVADELATDSKMSGRAIPSETSVKRVLGRRK